ncbi:MAG TPA: signal peptidase II [Acidimicrobiia bacterium]
MRSTLTSRRLSLVIAGLVVFVDQLTKRWALAALNGGQVVVIPGLLAFELNTNTGAAFGFLRGGGTLLGIAAIVAVAVILHMTTETVRPLEHVALGLILGGAIGNLIDRIVRGDGFLDGAVVDWIQLPNFPTFNVADSAITVGAFLLILGALRRP